MCLYNQPLRPTQPGHPSAGRRNTYSGVKAGGNAWERRSKALISAVWRSHGLKERVFPWERMFPSENIVLSMGTQLMNLKLAKITAWTRNTGGSLQN